MITEAPKEIPVANEDLTTLVSKYDVSKTDTEKDAQIDAIWEALQA